VALIGSARNETNADLVREWRALGLEAELLSASEAVRRLQPGDVAIGRLDVLPTLDGVEAGLVDLLRLKAGGVRVLNGPRALLAAHDKLLTAHLLGRAGVRHVPTLLVRPGDTVEVEPPLVLKPRFGSWGRDVFRCDSADVITETLELLAERPWFRRHGAVVQPLLRPMGRDLRVVVAGGRIAGADMRVAARNEWRTNVSLGGSELSATARPAEARLAIAAVEALGGDLLGVDLMPTPSGYVVLEVNGSVEFDRTYGEDVYAKVADALFNKEDEDVPLAGVLGLTGADRGAPVPPEAFADRPESPLATRR
jgi:RimK family alpha-L-glutamate ligase